MRIELENGELVSGSVLVDATLRTTLEPIPCSFECKLRLHEEYAPYLLDGKVIKVGKHKTPLKIVFVEDGHSQLEQGGMITYRTIIALHDNSVGIAHRLGKAVIRENVSLSEVYQSCGGTSPVGRDFKISRFYCYNGYFPSAEIAQACQDNGGVIRLIPSSNAIEFWRIYDLFNQKPVSVNDASLDSTVLSGFLEKHELPIYVSTNPDGTFSRSSFSVGSARSVEYVPQRSQQALNARSSVLLNVKMIPTAFNPDLNAGDLITIGGTKFVVITAAHRITNDGGQVGDSTSLWLGVKS